MPDHEQRQSQVRDDGGIWFLNFATVAHRATMTVAETEFYDSSNHVLFGPRESVCKFGLKKSLANFNILCLIISQFLRLEFMITFYGIRNATFVHTNCFTQFTVTMSVR